LGEFSAVSSAKSGFLVPGDGKSLTRVSRPKGDLFIATQNQDSVLIFSPTGPAAFKNFAPRPDDQWAELIFQDGKKQKVEFYWGSGYLSQSSRKINLSGNIKEVVFYDSKGRSRSQLPN
jgi:hypothetical protein